MDFITNYLFETQKGQFLINQDKIHSVYIYNLNYTPPYHLKNQQTVQILTQVAAIRERKRERERP